MSPSAADLITYIGVPLTIIGLLPIAYNAIATLIHASKIKKILSRNKTSAKLHSAIFNRVVEIEFPKYVIQPPQSHLGHGQLSPATRCDILGGSWTFLKWDRHQIRTETQRTQPGDSLRQPQAQIRFWDLIVRLYVLGARVDDGWSELYERPLWARACRLMTLENPDKKSSLVLQVSSYASSDSSSPISLELIEHGTKCDWSANDSKIDTLESITLPTAVKAGGEQASGDLICKVTSTGLVAVSAVNATDKTPIFDHLRIIDDQSTYGVWFASSVTALYAQSRTPILHHKVPANIRRVAKARNIPVQAVDLLYGIAGEEIPLMTTRLYLKKHEHPNDRNDEGQESRPESLTDRQSRREKRKDIPLYRFASEYYN